jgi:chorismate dehydratase
VEQAGSQQRPLRVGAVSYLNTKPLVCGLARHAAEVELVFDLPSRLAGALDSGRLDVALVPSIECLRRPDYVIVSDACIACRGPVLSVQLLSRVPLERIRVLALDEGSRTSVALARILLDRCFQNRPATVSLPIGQEAERAEADAVLLIGDRAIHAGGREFPIRWDLGQQWCAWAGLPFVFAVWAARPAVDQQTLATVLTAARDRGMANLDVIARQQADTVGLTEDACLAYLRDNLHFFLGPKERRGLRLFFDCCEALELAEPPMGLRPAERTQ